jgi:hypothetical protein
MHKAVPAIGLVIWAASCLVMLAAAETSTPTPTAPTSATATGTPTHTLRAWVLLPDLARSQTRWQAGPLSRLATRPWMMSLLTPLTEICAKRDLAQEDVIAEAQALRNLAAGIATPLAPYDRGSAFFTMTGSGEQTLLARLIGSKAIELPVDGWPAWVTGAHDVVMREQGWIWRSTPVALPMVATSLLDDLSPSYPEADAEATLSTNLIALIEDEFDIRLPFSEADALSAQWWLTENGVHEIIRETCHDDLAATFRDQPLPAIAPERVLSLPGDTIVACAFTINHDTFAAWFATPFGEAFLTAIEERSTEQNLPSCSAIIGGLRDDARIWCEAGAPFATIHVDVGCEATVAETFLTKLTDDWQFTVNPDASVQRQYQAIAVSVRYLDGRLQLSTSPFGFADMGTNDRHFGDHPAVQQAQQQWQKDAWCIAASRSNASWFALGGLIQLGLMTGGERSYGTLAADLHRAGTCGWLSIQFDGERTMTCDSAGLFGGPATWLMANAISSEIMFTHNMDELAKPMPGFPPVAE